MVMAFQTSTLTPWSISTSDMASWQPQLQYDRPRDFGGLVFDGDRIVEFTEKPQIGEGWINGGFFVLEPDVLEYIAEDQTSWEREPMERLATEGNLMAYRHEDFWQCMDTLRDLRLLEGLWTGGKAPWQVWKP